MIRVTAGTPKQRHVETGMKKILIALLATALIMMAPPAVATVLTFDANDVNQGDPLPAEYGDNVGCIDGGDCCDSAGCYQIGNGPTPNVSVEYRAIRAADGALLFHQLNYWDVDYGDLEDVAYAPEQGMLAEIALIPDPGFEVILNSFDLGAWPREDQYDQIVRVLDGNGNVLLDFSPVTVRGAHPGTGEDNGDGEGPREHTWIRLAQPIVAESALRIQFGPNWRIGIDNIDFDQTVDDGSGECSLDAECQAGLSATASALVACEMDLDVARSEVSRLGDDEDADRLPDLYDACPGTVSGVEIDRTGCSRWQFCGSVDATQPTERTLCKKLDWQNDEPLMKSRDRDCTLDMGRRDSAADDRCIPAF